MSMPQRSAAGTVLIAFLLCPTSALLWAGRWRLALFYLVLHVAVTALVVWLAHAGVEPLHGLGQRRPELLLYVANAFAALPAAFHATRETPRSRGWYSSVIAVIGTYVAIGLALFKLAKPFLSA